MRTKRRRSVYRPAGVMTAPPRTPEPIGSRLGNLSVSTLAPPRFRGNLSNRGNDCSDENHPRTGSEVGSAIGSGVLAASELRRFFLQRHEDETGVSGTGIVADGAVAPDGRVALFWRWSSGGVAGFGSVGLYVSVEELLQIHGHHGRTTLVWMDV